MAARGTSFIHVTREAGRAAQLIESLAFFAPELQVLEFPAWDCLPYDRVSPVPEIVSRRIDTLATLAGAPATSPRIVVTTVNAILQRVPPRGMFTSGAFTAEVGRELQLDTLTAFLARNGYVRADTVREAGEYALRGGIVDLFPPGTLRPLRLDLFGDTLEAIRSFDPTTQLSGERLARFVLKPVSEVLLDAAAIERFRTGYRELFGAVGGNDPLYEAISAGRRYGGFEHWLPLFHEKLETLFDYLADATVTLDHQCDEAVIARFEQIEEAYDSRAEFATRKDADGPAYRPLLADRLYLTARDWRQRLSQRQVAGFTPFSAPVDSGPRVQDLGGRPGLTFAQARTQADNVFDAVRGHVADRQAGGRRVVIAAYSEGSRDRLQTLFAEHGLADTETVAHWSDALALPPRRVVLTVLGLERGFETDDLAVISEQDILGERLIRAAKRRVRAENFIAEASTLAEGDLVVHVDHGVGRFEGLVTITAGGAPHDCLKLAYADNDRLFVPVENLDMLSRYGSEEGGGALDKLGGVGWQQRKARVKRRITEIAGELVKIAAARRLRQGEPMDPPEGLFAEFCARFPFPETEDQAKAIEDTLTDLASGKPMDRLICGDVGFGKTEVALRAAFVAAMAGHQVAVVVPTTLLCRQHFRNFTARFQGLPLKIAQLSRFVAAKDATQTRKALAEGAIDIVVGTTAVLSKAMAFKNLGLLIVDEEQHFGVGQKERLKQLKANVHVLTLTATPIPRTLQMALSGVRDMSIIASPPVDRLAVRTFVLPYDPVVIREAIMRERFRGGQTFYVCPRIEDLDHVRGRLTDLVPECKVAVAHGQMSPGVLEDTIGAFTEGKFDVLLSTNIVESGLDMPRVNTIVLHRADMFGLAQLYQLRGRVGRSKLRAYAYLTIPPDRVLGQTAQKRLEVMQTLDSLGAGFQLASYDLDIRGAGNMLGEEQSGHIREVGIELYQHMLEEAVVAARAEGEGSAPPDEWSPQINIGMAVLIPEAYVADLAVRLGLYRRLSAFTERAELDAFAAELVDRFGKLPPEAQNLLEVVAVKQLCRKAGVEKIDAGPKGAVLSFRQNRFAKPDRLIHFITRDAASMKVRPDQKLVYAADWDDARARMRGVAKLIAELAKLVE
ncbi:MAG: transcription-repair coupling factor [Alphaproteobacteria bacterium]|nr:transcription-repair coupling factor [Alphaproteobacteria bacterium]